MSDRFDPVLQTLTQAATRRAGARFGWLVSRRDDDLDVVAVSGTPTPPASADALTTSEITRYVL
ncbi:MAG: hypothetical protein ACYDD7_25110, partial [Acidimicrobiales bacterium]